jgi:glycosyltransferase involved in cell wall biosynthesis
VARLLIIIPAYNEEKSIKNVVGEIIQNYKQYDYIVINDGSSDKTLDVCRENGYNIIDLPINLGINAAMQTGMQYAYEKGYDYALQFDADGQHLPEYIPLLLKTIKKGYDVVIASRFLETKKHMSLRMLGSRILSFIIRLTTRQKITDPTSGMRLYNRKMIMEFALNHNYDPEPDTMAFLIRNNASITEVQVTMELRKHGESFFNVVNSIIFMVRMSISILIIQWARKREEHYETRT